MSHSVLTEDIRQVFDDIWRETGIPGLRNCVVAMKAMAARYPGGGVQITLRGLETPAHSHTTIVMRLHANSSIDTTILLPASDLLEVPLSSSRTASPFMARVCIDIGFRLTEQPTPSGAKLGTAEVAIADMLIHLEKNCLQVVSTICSKVVFPTAESFAQRVAETLLRTVKILDTKLEICSAKVKLIPQSPKDRRLTQVWAELDDTLLHLDTDVGYKEPSGVAGYITGPSAVSHAGVEERKN
jgi:hypothetical protein